MQKYLKVSIFEAKQKFQSATRSSAQKNVFGNETAKKIRS